MRETPFCLALLLLLVGPCLLVDAVEFKNRDLWHAKVLSGPANSCAAPTVPARQCATARQADGSPARLCLRVITCAHPVNGWVHLLYASAANAGIEVTNVCDSSTFTGSETGQEPDTPPSEPGEAKAPSRDPVMARKWAKPRAYLQFLRGEAERQREMSDCSSTQDSGTTVYLLIDSYDVLWNGLSAHEVLQSFANFAMPLVASTEKNCWLGRPCTALEERTLFAPVPPPSDPSSKYPNSGAIAGTLEALTHAMAAVLHTQQAAAAHLLARGPGASGEHRDRIEETVFADDQASLALYALQHPDIAALDHDQRLFGSTLDVSATCRPNATVASCATPGPCCTVSDNTLEAGRLLAQYSLAECVVGREGHDGQTRIPALWHGNGSGRLMLSVIVLHLLLSCPALRTEAVLQDRELRRTMKWTNAYMYANQKDLAFFPPDPPILLHPPDAPQ